MVRTQRGQISVSRIIALLDPVWPGDIVTTFVNLVVHPNFVSSVRSSSVYTVLLHTYIPSRPLFQIFQILQILKCLKDPMCTIFRKSMGFKDIKYDIPATSRYSFSDSELILFLFQTLSSHNLSHSTQYTEH